MSSAAVPVREHLPATTPRMGSSKILFSWIGVSLLAFPAGGYLGWGIGGHVDSVMPALIGGALTGAGIGLVQWLWLRRDLGIGPTWLLATGIALAAGLSIGAALVDYKTNPGSLAIMGAISGAAVGIAQGLLLRIRFSLWMAWIVAMPIMWAVGWVVTESMGIDVAKQFTVFGAFGAIAFGVLSGLLLIVGRRIQVQTA